MSSGSFATPNRLFTKIFNLNHSMRQAKYPQLKIGETPIAEVKIDLKSRDDIPPVLLGLQYIYTTVDLRQKVFEILERQIQPGTDKKNGRPGMELWKILVLGVLRLNLNWDYDRLVEMANNHKTIRLMLGHSSWEDDHEYKLQTIKDNVSLLTPDLLVAINTVVVEAGHNLVKKKRRKAAI